MESTSHVRALELPWFVLQTHVYRITSESPQKSTGVFSFENYPASRKLPWAGHAARMHKNRLPKRLMLS
jgi:hypothetical protein